MSNTFFNEPNSRTSVAIPGFFLFKAFLCLSSFRYTAKDNSFSSQHHFTPSLPLITASGFYSLIKLFNRTKQFKRETK